MMDVLRPVKLTLAIAALLAGTQALAETRVLAALPITYGLAHQLLQGSDIQLDRAAAANLPGSRQSAYFSGRGASALHDMAVKADAVIGLRSVWVDDPLYPMARRSNIRIVEIDAARPVDGALPGVALQPGVAVDGLNSQPWLSSNNLGRMADVTAADLVRLVPAAKPRIESNLANLKQQLLKLSADTEKRLGELDNLSVFSLSDHFSYLVNGLNLEAAGSEVRTDDQWTEDALAYLTQQLQDGDVAVVLDHRQPPEPVKAAIAKAGVHLLVLESAGEDPLVDLKAHIDQLLGALEQKG